MRDCVNSRGGFDRVLMAVAATFLTVSASSAIAQGDPARKSAAELAIEAAVPMPEPANLPPPTASDFKSDSTAAIGDAAKASDAKPDGKPAEMKTGETKPPETKAPEAKPADVATVPPKIDTPTAPAAPAPTAATPAAEPVKEPVKA